MAQLFFATLIIVGLAVLFLGIRVFFVKGGRFPNIHIGGSKAMRERGVSCATSQDREAQASARKKGWGKKN